MAGTPATISRLEPHEKRGILADLDAGMTPQVIAFNRSVPVESVRAVFQARRAVRNMRGQSPRVVWANFQDLLTAKECGL